MKECFTGRFELAYALSKDLHRPKGVAMLPSAALVIQACSAPDES